MTATTQPISFSNANQSTSEQYGSYSGTNGSYMTVQYRPQYIGSPVSWRAGSFGSRFYPGCSPGQLMGPLDPNDFRCSKLSSSMESDRGSLLNALSAFDREDELCRNYTCCGLQLTDLHALIEHFEEVHVVVVDPFSSQPQQQAPHPSHRYSSVPSSQFAPDANAHIPAYQGGPFDPDDMEMDMEQTSSPSSSAPTPPDTPLSTPLTSYPTHSFNQYPHSTPASTCPSPNMPVSAFETTTIMPSRSHLMNGLAPIPLTAFPSRSGQSNFLNAPEAFNAYAGYSNFSSSMPGTVPSPTGAEAHGIAHSQPGSPHTGCVPPALLFSTTTTPEVTPAASRDSSPPHAASRSKTASSAAARSSSAAAASAAIARHAAQHNSHRASTTLSRPSSSLLLSKPFRCPKTNCNKSYKQANGLKYHMTHGSCNFAPPKDLEQVQALLASKRSQKEAAGEEDGLETITEGEMREVEKEAERRLKPYACCVGDCQRRYKNMNGLRYHYQHSGDHGAIGLGLLASGQHECLQHGHARSHSSAAASRQTTPFTSGISTPVSGGRSTPMVSQAVNGLSMAMFTQQFQQVTFSSVTQQVTPYTVHPQKSPLHQEYSAPSQYGQMAYITEDQTV